LESKREHAEHEAEIKELRRRGRGIKEESEEALISNGEFRSEKEELEERLRSLMDEESNAEEELRISQEVRSEAEAELRKREAAVEIQRLEGELAIIEGETKQCELAESTEDFRAPLDRCKALQLEQQRQCQRLKDEHESFCRDAADLDLEQPRLEIESAEIKQCLRQEHQAASQLRAELERFLNDDGDLLPPSPGGRSPTRHTPRPLLSKTSEQEAWQLESEAQASKLRMNELEEVLEQSCRRRRHDIAEGESRARRLANLKVRSDGVCINPSAQVTALAVGMRAANSHFDFSMHGKASQRCRM